MRSINSCTFTGRTGRDPEVRYFESGTAVAQFTIAVQGFKSDAPPLWLPVKVWGKQAQTAADLIRKGALIGVSGELENETWTDRTTGEERSKVILNAREFTMLETKEASESRQQRDGGGDGSSRSGGRQAAPARNGGWNSRAADQQDEEDIPF